MDKRWVLTEEPLGGYTLRNIVHLLAENRFRIDVKYWPRFLYGLTVAALFSPLRVVESLRFDRAIRDTTLRQDPVFIIGYYRSGTTYLNTLFSLDRSKGYVSNVEGYLPCTFLAFPWLSEWMVALSLPEERPMDTVALSPAEPIEEEYSIGAYETFGLYNGFIFPRNFRRYSGFDGFEGKSEQLARWKRRYRWFVKKMTLKYGGRQIVFKNPTHSFRLPQLLRMYPNAKFVHIYRNPYKLFSSNVRYHREVFDIYALQSWNDDEMQLTILDNYKRLFAALERDRHLIPNGNFVEVCYEEFIRDPMADMARIYQSLGLEGFPEYRHAMEAHVKRQRAYKPNVHVLSKEVIRRVNAHWGHIVERLGYELLPA